MSDRDYFRDIKDIAKEARRDLKAALPNCKFSVTISRFSMGQAMDVALMAAPSDPFAGEDKGTTYSQLNQYTFLRDWEPDEDGNVYSNGCTMTAEGAEMLTKAIKIATKHHWDDSDPMTDYFSTNFYIHLSVGKWDKPFTVTG